MDADQSVMENVALLGLWGTNTWVLSIDVDEFLLPIRPIQQLGCMAKADNPYGMVRYDDKVSQQNGEYMPTEEHTAKERTMHKLLLES